MRPFVASPREMAAQRRRDALIWLALCGVFLGLPLGLQFTFDFTLPWWSYFFFLAGARFAYCELKERLQAARRFDQGADGEDEIAGVLAGLPPGWQVERNLDVPGVGDIDFFVQAPDGRLFVIDVKSHGGSVVLKGDCLQRVKNGVETPFEKDFLFLSVRQALALRFQRHLPFIHAVLVFTRAELQLPERLIGKVHVLTKGQLVDFLLHHEARNGRVAANPGGTTGGWLAPAGGSSPAAGAPGDAGRAKSCGQLAGGEAHGQVAHVESCGQPSAAWPAVRENAGSNYAAAPDSCSHHERERGKENACSCSPRSGEPSSCSEMDEILLVAVATGVGPVKRPYRVRLHACWRCQEKILVFTWPDHVNWMSEKPPAPVPKSIKWSWSKSAEAYYWANTCLRCGAVQGDQFVHDEPSDYEWRDIEIFGKAD